MRSKLPWLSSGRRKSANVSAGPFWPKLRCSLLTDRFGYARRSRLAWTKKSTSATLPDLRLAVRGFCSALILFLASERALADQIEMQNGDHYVGTVLTMNSNYVEIQSEVLGTVKIPRAKVTSVSLGSNGEAKTATTAAPKSGQAAAVPRHTTNSPPANSAALRQLAAHTNLIHQVEDKFLKDSGPEAKAKFDELMQGLSSGKIGVQEIRSQASDAVIQIKALKSEGGEQFGGLLDTYQGVLEKFIKETTPPANTLLTNAPAANKP
jgi:hypothetical protein